MTAQTRNLVKEVLQWVVIGITNLLFICKYCPRTGLNPIVGSILYGVMFIGLIWLYRQLLSKYVTEHIARWASVGLIVGILAFITLSIVYIDPYSIQVDRWSATTFFLDGLFHGIYPYGIHTHLFEENFPSPFPLWQYLNIPFWLIGDVGWIQGFFLLLFLGAIYYFFRSWHSVLITLLIFYISPAYWWELATRSDSLSNALLVCSVILLVERYPIRMENKWWLLAIISGCIASTRLSAVIPIALYLFYPWLAANWKKKIGFVGITFAVVLFTFLPYIFWDTNTWIFLQRNPLMSQTSLGSNWLLVIMIIIAILISYKQQSFDTYMMRTSSYMFTFMLVMLLGIIYRSGGETGLFDTGCDISYLTLSMPYAIIALMLLKNNNGYRIDR